MLMLCGNVISSLHELISAICDCVSQQVCDCVSQQVMRNYHLMCTTGNSEASKSHQKLLKMEINCSAVSNRTRHIHRLITELRLQISSSICIQDLSQGVFPASTLELNHSAPPIRTRMAVNLEASEVKKHSHIIIQISNLQAPVSISASWTWMTCSHLEQWRREAVQSHD